MVLSDMMDMPLSPTHTVGIQKAFALSIRKAYMKRLQKVYSILKRRESYIKESLQEGALDVATIKMIMEIVEGIKFDLSPLVLQYIHMSWNKGNSSAARMMKLGSWVPYDKRVLKSLQDVSYKYLYKFTDERQKELKDILYKGIKEGDTVKTIADNIKDSFEDISMKSELIARTEVIRVHGEATKVAIKNGGVTSEYKWLTSQKENVCSKCKPLHGRVFSIDDKRAPMPVKDTHPRCSCGIVPYVRVNLNE